MEPSPFQMMVFFVPRGVSRHKLLDRSSDIELTEPFAQIMMHMAGLPMVLVMLIHYVGAFIGQYVLG